MIEHVSDTAFWVAHYRAKESKRPDALFRDEFAAELSGDRGARAAQTLRDSARYTEWTVVLRTRVIDEMILAAIADGIDTVINLGAGLDSRPYRLDLPGRVRWIEADYPAVIDFKENMLSHATPRCRLERVRIDLADRDARSKFLESLASTAGRTLVLTEGVILYLGEADVAELARDLHRQGFVEGWIAEYQGPIMKKYLMNDRRMEKMKRAPFRFFPEDWFEFFAKLGWKPREVKYLGEESSRFNRPFPLPLWAKLLRPVFPKERRDEIRRMMGYVRFVKSAA